LAPVKSEIVEIVEEVNGNHEIAPPDTENSSFEELEVSITFFFIVTRARLFILQIASNACVLRCEISFDIFCLSQPQAFFGESVNHPCFK